MPESLHVETPLWEWNPRKPAPGPAVHLKMEALHPVGSFKIRGLGRVCREHVREKIRAEGARVEEHDEVAWTWLVPDAVVVSVGGGGLLCGVLEGMQRAGWSSSSAPLRCRAGERRCSRSGSAGAGMILIHTPAGWRSGENETRTRWKKAILPNG